MSLGRGTEQQMNELSPSWDTEREALEIPQMGILYSVPLSLGLLHRAETAAFHNVRIPSSSGNSQVVGRVWNLKRKREILLNVDGDLEPCKELERFDNSDADPDPLSREG